MSEAAKALPTGAAVRVDLPALIALLIGTAIISWTGILVRFLDVGPLAGAAWRMTLAVPALALWSGISSGARVRRSDIAAHAPSLIFAGLAFAVDVGCFHLSLTGTNVANATFIGNSAPIVAVLGGALFFREQPAARVWPALALALFGSWVMAGMLPPSRIGHGDAFALVAACAYASYLLFIKQAREKLDGATATMLSAAVSAVALILAAVPHGEKLIPTTAAGWATVALLGFVSHAGGQGLTSVAVGRLPVALVAVVLLAQPPVSAALAYLALGEPMSALQIAGGALILAAVILARPK